MSNPCLMSSPLYRLSQQRIYGRLATHLVAAIASNDVWAVGAISGNNIQTLTEHWNGSAWSVVSSSGPGLAINNLNGIAAISSNNVWAVGDDADSGAPSAQFRPLIQQWNGSSW